MNICIILFAVSFLLTFLTIVFVFWHQRAKSTGKIDQAVILFFLYNVLVTCTFIFPGYRITVYTNYTNSYLEQLNSLPYPYLITVVHKGIREMVDMNEQKR